MNKSHEITRKITLAALMLVLNVIFNRLFMFASITTLNKISVADVFVLFSSIYLGPLYGMVVGGFGDLFGALIMPRGDINWFITLAKFIGGLVPGLLYMLFKHIKSQRILQVSCYALMAIISTLITVFLNVVPTIKIFEFQVTIELWAKILFPCLAFGLSILLFVVLYLIDKKYHFEPDYLIWLVVIIYEITFPLIIYTIVKSLYYSVDFIPIFAIQLLLFIVDIGLNILILNLLKRVKKISRFA